MTLEYISRLSALVWLLFFVWTSTDISTTLQEQDESRLSVTLNCRRPLAEVVRTLEQRHGIVVTYEDPPYLHDSQRFNGAIPGRRASFVPKGGPFSFEYVIPQQRAVTTMKPVLTALLRQYSATGYAGHFELYQTDDSFHVVPVSRRAENGLEEPYDAILSTELSPVAAGTASGCSRSLGVIATAAEPLHGSSLTAVTSETPCV